MHLTVAENLTTGPGGRCSRREFLRIGSLGLTGWGLADWLACRAQAGTNRALRDKAVILLFLQGGPPQIETFDPKLTAPAEIRSATGEVATRLPGITFGGTFPQLAARADRLAVVRSFASKNGGHTYESVATGRNNLKAAMGAIYARVAGTNHPLTGMPSNMLVLPEAVDPAQSWGKNFETQALPTLTSAGQLGARYEALNPSGGGDLLSDMRLQLPRERFDDRRSLLAQLDGYRRAWNSSAGGRTDEFRQQAFEILVRGIAQAFDLSQEDPRTLARYDTTPLFKQADWTRFYNMKRSSNLLGKQLLLARRLVEAGCRFITVSDCGWDLHADSNSAPGLTAMESLGRQVDHAVAAFIDDVHARGMSQDVLLIVTGEMGRTPRRNKNGGRDHWGDLTPLLLTGGGLAQGQVIGQSNAHAAEPLTAPHDPGHLMATVFHTLFDVGELRLDQTVPREIRALLETTTPIAGLV